MKIEQSCGQYIFNRLYTESVKVFIGFIVILFFGLFAHNEPNTGVLFFACAIPILFTVWILVFNSGSGEVIKHGLEINEQEITYIRYGEKKSIAWSDYNGFRVTKGWLRQVVILSSSNNSIVFDYYAFSGEQRRKLFDKLDTRNCQ